MTDREARMISVQRVETAVDDARDLFVRKLGAQGRSDYPSIIAIAGLILGQYERAYVERRIKRIEKRAKERAHFDEVMG